nr:fused MFS/spermidine synthase [Chloroflexota bacterium]
MQRRISIAIFVMGFSGLVAEVLLLRELLIVFSGNELGIGIILGNWLVLEAFGCIFPGRMVEKCKNRLEIFAVISILFSFSLLIAVFLTRILRNMLGISVGESVGLLPLFYSSFLILLPVSMLHGALFTFSCRIYSIFSGQDAPSAGRVYVYETVGTIVGGFACTYLLVPHFHAFQAAIGLAMLNLVVCLALLAPYWKTGLLPKTMLVTLSMLVILSGYALFTSHADKLHQRSIQAQWKNLRVVHYQNSQYGNICVVENQGQYIYFSDGLPTLLTPIPDMPSVEEFVHLPLLAHPAPAKVLIVSGGAGGVINEALKHPSIEAIEYAELDPLLLSLLRKFPTPLTESELNDERVKIHYVDGRLLLRTMPHTYDLIFIGITEPSSLQVNRLFTKEFFSLVQKRLNKGGILVLGAPGSLTFLNEELKNLNSCIFHTLSSVFVHVRVIPGDGRNVFLASDSPQIFAMDKTLMVRRLTERGISAHVMVPWYIENKLHPGWQDWFMQFLEGSSRKINYDFQPLGLFYSISYWNALFAPAFGWLFKQFDRINLEMIFLLFVLFLLTHRFLRTRNTRFLPTGIPFAIVTTGFAGMVFDLIVIFTFQSIYGYVFSWIGLLTASFMAGAACGASLLTAGLARVQNDLKLFLGIELAIIGFSLGLPLAFSAANALTGNQFALTFLCIIMYLILSFISGFLIGSQFPLANKLYLRNNADLSRTAGLLYASDLLGGWLGGMAGAVVLLPVLGVTGTCITVGLLKLASYIVISARPPINV